MYSRLVTDRYETMQEVSQKAVIESESQTVTDRLGFHFVICYNQTPGDGFRRKMRRDRALRLFVCCEFSVFITNKRRQ